MKSLIFAACLFPFLTLGAQGSLFDVLHATGDTVELKMETNWKKILRKKQDKEYFPGTFAITYAGGTETFAGRVRSRGNIRLEVCPYPSLKIKLKKKDLVAAGFTETNDLKLIIQCSGNSLGESYLLKEKLAYDLHALVSEYTHRIFPTRVVVGDGDTLMGVFIEAEEQLETRYGARVLETNKLSTGGLQRQMYINMCLFNYLILNTDWNVYNLHNVEFINPEGSLDIIPIPYDFDYSGLVGAHYAVPSEGLSISSVHEPEWRGRNVSEIEIKEGARFYLERRQALTEMVEDYPGLSDRDRKRILKRFEDFFDLLAEEKKLLRLIE